ncbi:DUF4389 domain-containing protein [Sinomonas sp. ASV486]|uniref:DUF4389 domain-containing protein n=1 Tax=Sinomonas puerhi TaxID=3238584 RepID=A0AB39L3G0_9MICC|nr:DUF4389 domain-containing protein [Sinomonas sp. ASV486]MDQ4491327.1 DUF4389 domain-containing protein [Sinomonas sp. ASV486]
MSAQPSPTNAFPDSAARGGAMKPGHWVLLVLGVLLAALGVGLVAGGAVLLSGDAAQRDGQYLQSQRERLRTTGYAMLSRTVAIDLGSAASQAAPGMPRLGDLASVRISAASAVPGQQVFVGIADASTVADYLRGVPSASLGDVAWSPAGVRPPAASGQADRGELAASAGDRTPGAPKDQNFWVASASGPGTQALTFDLREGNWALVVMNVDATRPLWTDLQVGVRSRLVGPIGTGLLVSGLIGMVIGVPLLLFGAAGLGRDIGLPTTQAQARAVYPVRFSGFLDPKISRGLWIIKWLLVIPHGIVLAVLWFALFVTTIAAGFAIVVTGRYPRPLFSFSVGVLRWTWRVGFYAYAALGTDRYPPFSLASADYPADLDVDYPERLSRGLVLVKSWLLALPQLMIVAVLTGGVGTQTASGGAGPSLLGLLVFFAAVIVLFTGRYAPQLFGLVVGIDRWLFRVWAYVLLMRDEYPPLRLDQGPLDPGLGDRPLVE